MRALAILAVPVALALTACAGPDAGTVVSKRYEPAYDWTELTCASYRSNGTCALQVPNTRHEPERWVLVLRAGDDEGDRDVYREAFERCMPGATYPQCAGGAS
ncbi:hypothetical protein [Nonomuraea angiospora]|uniref:hypothetical protein n=1 Tax=Nonomuraea angiospora TaxID=46172 RepID=UPI0029AAFBAF|nr:hypothetical protein [Nonomuraea angiospora]MDX3109691.1 hypothetical protein [Nonomuraea angiospora]